MDEKQGRPAVRKSHSSRKKGTSETRRSEGIYISGFEFVWPGDLSHCIQGRDLQFRGSEADGVLNHAGDLALHLLDGDGGPLSLKGLQIEGPCNKADEKPLKHGKKNIGISSVNPMCVTRCVTKLTQTAVSPGSVEDFCTVVRVAKSPQRSTPPPPSLPPISTLSTELLNSESPRSATELWENQLLGDKRMECR